MSVIRASMFCVAYIICCLPQDQYKNVLQMADIKNTFAAKHYSS
jgi:hypothetical protein